MNYVNYINNLLKSAIERSEQFVAFGQNISAGSCLGGLTCNFDDLKGCTVLNTPNTENSLVGMGFGLMLSGVSSALFLKQQDFLLLGIDHLRNTNNFARQSTPKASFAILNITMDAGYEGIQSSLNNLPDFCRISDCMGFTISSKQEAHSVINTRLLEPGFKIISISQRLLKTEILDLSNESLTQHKDIFLYDTGEDMTICCFNFSLSQGKSLCEKLYSNGIKASLYSVTASHNIPFEPILQDGIKTGKLLILDDSKSIASSSTQLELEAIRLGIKSVLRINRDISEDTYRPNQEIYELNYNEILNNMNFN